MPMTKTRCKGTSLKSMVNPILNDRYGGCGQLLITARPHFYPLSISNAHLTIIKKNFKAKKKQKVNIGLRRLWRRGKLASQRTA